MCGIVGILNFGNSPGVNSDDLTRMRDTMLHRGPDGAGLWVSPDGRIGLGHRRLAIIDISPRAAQPMSNEDGSLQVVFNGEIYNHAEIRRELESLKKYRWKTDHSDTEVIIHAFEEWGIDCLKKFRGMFAMAIWDERKKELWLIRDRIGVKPLYYANTREKIIFASEIKAILKAPGQKPRVNEEALFHFLSFITTPAPDTMFQGVKKLLPGTYLKIKTDGTIAEKRYWELWENTRSLTGVGESQITEMILAELKTAVRLRKVSDVPVGVFLSGGIDSSANAALFSEGESRPVKTFTIGYRGRYQSYKNELPFARKMAGRIRADHHELLLTVDDFIDFLPEMIRLQDEPIADPVCFPIHFVSRLARENGVGVCQVGEGADELFCGYPWWKKQIQAQNYLDLIPFNSIKKMILFMLAAVGKETGQKYGWLSRHSQNHPIFWGGIESFPETLKRKLLSDRLRKKFSGYSSWEALEPVYRRFNENTQGKSILNWMSYLDLNLRLPELLLMRVDKMSMGASLEARVPFLDHKFVELIMSLPQKIKFKNNELKYILKKTLRGVIPDELIDRKKQGFAVPIDEWFFDKLGEKMKTDLKNFCRQTDYFDPAAVQQMIEKQKGPELWYLFNFVLWHREFIEK